MKRFISLTLGLVIAVLLPIVAKAYSVTVNVDDTARVQVIRYGDPLEIVAGDNVIEYNSDLNITIRAVEGAILEEISSSSYNDMTQNWVAEYDISGGSRLNGRTYTVKSKMIADVRTSSFTLNIDDAAKAYCILSNSNYQVPMVNGDNTVAFIPDVENWLTIGSMTTAPLVSVTKNGTAVSPSWNVYNVEVADGDIVTVQTLASADAVAKLKVLYDGNGEGCINSIEINDTAAEFVNPIIAKPGDKVTFNFNRTDYTVSKVQIDNEPPVTVRSDRYSVYLNEGESNFTVIASKNSFATVALRLADPDHVKVYRGSRYDMDEITDLVAGDNTLQFKGVNPKMDIVAKTDCVLKSVTVNGTEKIVDGELWAFLVNDGDSIVVESEKTPTEPTYAYSIKLDIDNPENVEVYWVENDVPGDTIAIVAGENTLGYNGTGEYKITAKPGMLLTSVKNITEGYDLTSYCNTYSIWCSESASGNTYSVATGIESEIRNGSFVLSVDDPANVVVTRSGTYTTIENLVAGDNNVRFIKDVENTLQIRHAKYGTPLYSVCLNGVEQSESWGSYNVSIAEGDSVQIRAKFPEGPAALGIEFVNGDSACVSKITLNGEEIPVSDTVSGKLGDQVEVFFNETDYVINSVAINGGEPETSSWGFYSRTVVLKQPVNTLTIDASKNVSFDITLTLSNPDHVNVFRGSEWDYDMFEGLTTGDNTLSFTSANTKMTIVGKNGYILQSVTANGEAIEVADNRAEVNVTEGMTVEVVTIEPVRDNTLVVYVNDINAAPYGYEIQRGDRSTLSLESGYNIVKYNDAELPMLFAFYCDEGGAPYAYNNGQTWASMYDGGAVFQLEAADNNSVVKFYFGAQPSNCNVSFDIAEGISTTVVRDIIIPVDIESSSSEVVLSGTQYTLTVSSPEGLVVMINDETATPQDNVYAFTVTADTRVSVKKTSGVENVLNDNVIDDVYNMQGIRVGTSSDLNHLARGIYFLNGKKFIVK